MSFPRRFTRCWLAALGVVAATGGCRRSGTGRERQAGPSPPSAATASITAPVAGSASAAANSAAEPRPMAAAELGRLVTEISEPDRYFFSDNFVSNETSYLQPVRLLRLHAAPHGAYLGVGPEQNFTYIALTRPAIAFIVDIRRQNMLEHLLFKAIFEEARSRSHFLCLLLGRPWTEQGDPGEAAGIDEVIAHAEEHAPNRESFDRAHARLRSRMDPGFAVPLSRRDHASLRRIHEAFFRDQLDIRFVLRGGGGRKYPTLRALLRARSPAGDAGSFLADEGAFRFVQRLERANRVIPVVGDFAGDRALPGIARELGRRRIPVSVFYVSNVEQYLLEDAKWPGWIRNVDRLPSNEKSLFLRAYLDQGRSHPHQMKGHRTTTTLQSFDHFKWRQRKRGYGGFWQLATDGVLGADAGGR